ncbi:MAG: phosphatase PAP2 family protein [Bacteroidota bacterium]
MIAAVIISLFVAIKDFDEGLFLLINSCNNSFFDFVMFYASERWVWIPFYLLLIFFLIKKTGKKTILAMLLIAAGIFITDQSCNLVKESVQRYRPTHNTELKNDVHIVNDYRGGQYGFVSSHAANTACLALFLSLILYRKQKYIVWIMWMWALLLSYSRIYLGVHYPSDVAGGMLVGAAAGLIIYFGYTKLEKYFSRSTV